jgi:hypothetical protein
MADHLLDEGRHSGFWTRLVQIYWSTAPEEDHEAIARLMPGFIADYLASDLQQAFDFELISHLPVDESVRQSLREDASALAYPINRFHPLVGNITRFFRGSSMLASPCVRDALADYLTP